MLGHILLVSLDLRDTHYYGRSGSVGCVGIAGLLLIRDSQESLSCCFVFVQPSNKLRHLTLASLADYSCLQIKWKIAAADVFKFSCNSEKLNMSDILIELSGWLRDYLICLTHFYKGINSTLMPFSFFSAVVWIRYLQNYIITVNVLLLKEKKIIQ